MRCGAVRVMRCGQSRASKSIPTLGRGLSREKLRAGTFPSQVLGEYITPTVQPFRPPTLFTYPLPSLLSSLPPFYVLCPPCTLTCPPRTLELMPAPPPPSCSPRTPPAPPEPMAVLAAPKLVLRDMPLSKSAMDCPPAWGIVGCHGPSWGSLRRSRHYGVVMGSDGLVWGGYGALWGVTRAIWDAYQMGRSEGALPCY